MDETSQEYILLPLNTNKQLLMHHFFLINKQ
jgi:hypothetical protein